MIISMIVAAAENNAIGKNNELLWNLPNDWRFFKNTTWAMPVIMGRKTFESLGKPLQGRPNIVITSKKDWQPEGAWVVNDLDAAIEKAKDFNTNEIFIIGGGHVYEQAMTKAERIYITRVHTSLEGDTYFPVINPTEWKLVKSNDFTKDEKHAFDYTFEVWERK